MPLLRRQPFVPQPPPLDIRPEEEIFYFPVTNEIFRDYEAFFERTILCNSLVWSCSLTAKSNLTYQEAIESEKRALQSVSDIPLELRQPLLLIASLTCRGKVNETCDDVYYFMKDRYFKNEHVEAILRSKWYPAQVIRVVPPTIEELEQYKQELDDELSTEDKLLMLDQYGPPPELFKYEVKEEFNSKDGSVGPIHTVTVDCIRREKGFYSRERVRLYLRYCLQFDECEGIWVVKPEAWNKLNMDSIKYSEFFTGEKPRFEEKRAPKKVNKSLSTSKGGETPKASKTPRTPKTPSNDKDSNGKGTPVKGTPSKRGQPDAVRNAKSATKSPKLDAEALAKEFIKIREERETLRQMADQRKQQKVDEKLLAKEKKKEEKRVMAEYVKEWSKIREDLECDDLKDLPSPTPIQCAIPNGIFGDFVMVLEFFLGFGEELQLKDAFPGGLTFELLERAVVENEVSGPLSDILQTLLSSLFEFQDAESEEVKEAGSTTSGVQESEVEGGLTYQGTPLKKLSMDSLTVSEILRLHLISSGGGSSELRTKWRYQQRGGYSAADDPGVQLRQEDPHILHALSHSTVYELPVGDKMKVIKCLCHQILTYASIRDILEEKSTKLIHLRQELKALHANERRMRKEDIINRAKLRSEENGNTEDGTELERLLQETAKRKGEVLKKEQQLRQQILRMTAMTHLAPLGQDRAFRRFWVFESLPGLFVEHDDDYVGTCLPEPTPYSMPKPNGLPIDPSKCKEDIRKFFKAANKENDISTEPVCEKPKIFGVCTSNPTNCPVHATYLSRTKWSFYENVDFVDQILLSLNERGQRESVLKNAMVREKERIVEGITKCFVHRLDNSRPEVKLEGETRKSTRQIRKEKEYDINLYFPAGTPVEEIMERTLVDMVLETEEKIFVGGLGSLKVKDRNAWRTSLEERKFVSQVETLTWGGKLETKTHPKLEHNDAEDEDNRSETSSSVEAETTANAVARKCVVDLACSLLQLAQSVETKYLKKPLGEDEKERKKRLKAEEAMKKWEDHKEPDHKTDAKTEPKTVRTPLEKWELSLHACTSLSQLYVHLALLDNSITWNRSALNARCRICRRKGDPEKMLLCDGCDKGHHMYCLKPLLTVVPEGDWFCAECKPREKPRTPRKARRVFSEESEDEAVEEEEADAGEEEAEVEAEEGESDVESVDNEICPVCQEGGEVICCDTCPAVYHLECINPPLRKVPRGKWSCPQCKTPPQDRERGKLREKNSDGRTGSARISRTRHAIDFDEEVKDMGRHAGARKRTQTEPVRSKSPADLALGKRRSAAEAVDKIAQSSKRLRGDSNDDESGNSDNNSKWNAAAHRKRSRPLPLPSATSPSGFVDLADLLQLLADLSSHVDSWPFLKPVTRAEAPDYHHVIKQAMDLGTMKYKLNSIKYKTAEDFVKDLQLIFTNCYTYNNDAADEYKCGRNLSRYAEKQLEKLGIKMMPTD
ncbi:bromodomain adjacent to zinc finger domain protein 1A-like isoform X2 [Daphnia pulex]|uniref:bromodomain adjacent to zinc finger domain protein 1A-like isoform X2 n=1 Tax=Daphnia pulex TaxID=6669 RepID=UPI001EDD1ADF|nr:bromodomain adjacent to zinc finger domain protein 1A-like isoform X2 [Daphnia pulex]